MSRLIKVAELIMKHVVEHYGDKISIVVIYGSVATGKESDYSDLDMYTITSLENQMKWSFIFQDKAVDIWAMDWEEAENIALANKEKFKIWCVAAHIFVNCKVLYYRNKEDLDRFNTLRKSVQQIEEDIEGNLNRAISQFNMDNSIERVKLAKLNNDILSARWAIWGLINNICAILSWLNNRYYTKNWASNLPEVFQFPIMPKNLHEMISILVSSSDFEKLLSTGSTLTSEIRKLIRNKQETIITNHKVLNKNDIVHMKEYFNKIYAACDKKDILLASYASTELQIWISEMIAQNKGIHINTYDFNLFHEVQHHYYELNLPDLTNFISNKDFKGLQNAANNLEKSIMQFYTQRKLIIPIFNKIADVDTYLNSLRN